MRGTFARIARDETHHATLAWDVLAWSLERIDDDARARVHAALRDAVGKLDPRSIAGASAEQREELGLPDVEGARRMIAVARVLLWSRSA